MPTLIALEAADGGLLGVMGVRAANEEPLFLEHYFDLPIEEVIAPHATTQPSRDCIIELGNPAAGSPGAARILIMALSAYLQGASFKWVVFTAAPSLRNAFTRPGLDLTPLGPASGSRLGARQRAWGSYYAHRPQVMAGDIHYGFERLNTLMACEPVQYLHGHLWRQALHQGRCEQRWCA